MAWTETKTNGIAVVWDTDQINPKTGKAIRDRVFIPYTVSKSARVHERIVEEFKRLITKHGDRRPDGYVGKCGELLRLDEEGELYVVGVVRAPGVAGGKSWADILTEYLASRAATASKSTRQRVAERFRAHFAERTVTLADGTTYGPICEQAPETLTALIASQHSAELFDTATYPACKGRCNPPCTCRRIPYSRTTIRDIYLATIKPVILFAVEQGYIRTDPFKAVKSPKRTTERLDLSKVPLGPEMAAWQAAAYASTSHMPDPFLAGDVAAIALGTGLRWSELAALRPCDVSRANGTVRVEQVIRTADGERPRIERAKAKSNASTRRTITVGNAVLEILERRSLCKGDEDLLFPAPQGGPWREPGFLRRYWDKVQKAMSRSTHKRVTIHGLRHAHITTLLRAGMDVATVAKRAGHDPAVTMRVYDHVITADQARAAGIMEAALMPATA